MIFEINKRTFRQLSGIPGGVHLAGTVRHRGSCRMRGHYQQRDCQTGYAANHHIMALESQLFSLDPAVILFHGGTRRFARISEV